MRASKAERAFKYLLILGGSLGAAAFGYALEERAARAEREELAKATWVVKTLARATAPSAAKLDRAGVAQSLRDAVGLPGLDAVAALGAHGEMLYGYGRRPGFVDKLLYLEPGIAEGEVAARAPLSHEGNEVGQLELALSNRSASALRMLRDVGSLSAGVVLLLALMLLPRRRGRRRAISSGPPARAVVPARPSGAALGPTEGRGLHTQLVRSFGREASASLANSTAMVQLLLDTKLDPKQRRYAEGLHESSRALLHTIEEVLEFVSVDDGNYQPRQVEFEIRTVLEQSVAMLAQAAHAKGLELSCSVDRAVPELAVADPDRVRQVLAHVVGNAVKFTERGEVIVKAQAEPGHESELMRIEVRDTGPGIATSEQAALFERVGREDDLLTQAGRGVGLGLAISTRLVRAMGGEIGVSSRPGAGSTFWFTLKVKPAPMRAALPPIALARRALIVDASRTARDQVKELLEQWQVDADGTDSTYEAIVRLERDADSPQPFDVMIIAERTSDLGGAELLHALSGHAVAQRTPLVLLTYSGSALSTVELSTAALVQLAKPVTETALHAAITQALERKPSALPAASPQTERRLSGRVEAPRALVVDDNEINQFAVVELLTELGFASDVARNGREAVEMTARHKYMIVFMDCEMPEMDGYEATREIRRSVHPFAHVPIIALTAHNAPEERQRGIDAGMNEYIAKPVRQAALESTLSRWASAPPPRVSLPAEAPQTAQSPETSATEQPQAEQPQAEQPQAEQPQASPSPSDATPSAEVKPSAAPQHVSVEGEPV